MKKKKIFRRRKHKVWQLQEAKAQFSQLINEVQTDGYYTITKNGHPVAVIMSREEFEELLKPKNTLLEFFENAPLPEVNLDFDRSYDAGRDVEL